MFRMSVFLLTVVVAAGCNFDNPAHIDVSCEPSDSGSIEWTTVIRPSGLNRFSLSGDLMGRIDVTDSSWVSPRSKPKSPWEVSHAVEVEESSNAGWFDVIFDGSSRRGSANTIEGAWVLAREEYVESVKVEILSWIQGQITAPALMRTTEIGR